MAALDWNTTSGTGRLAMMLAEAGSRIHYHAACIEPGAPPARRRARMDAARAWAKALDALADAADCEAIAESEP